MNKVIKYAIAYGMWIADLGLSLWLFYISRIGLLAFLALFYEPGDFAFSHRVDLIDKIFTVVLGLGWLAFSIVTEEKYRTSAPEENLLKCFARFTGPVLLCIFAVDLILFWLSGIGGDNWLRWLILASELGVGIALVVYGKIKPGSKSK